MIAIRKILHGFPFPSRDAYGAPLGGPSGRRSSAIKIETRAISVFSEQKSGTRLGIILSILQFFSHFLKA